MHQTGLRNPYQRAGITRIQPGASRRTAARPIDLVRSSRFDRSIFGPHARPRVGHADAVTDRILRGNHRRRGGQGCRGRRGPWPHRRIEGFLRRRPAAVGRGRWRPRVAPAADFCQVNWPPARAAEFLARPRRKTPFSARRDGPAECHTGAPARRKREAASDSKTAAAAAAVRPPRQRPSHWRSARP